MWLIPFSYIVLCKLAQAYRNILWQFLRPTFTPEQTHKFTIKRRKRWKNRRRFPPKTDDICASAEMLSGVVTLSITFARAPCSLKIGRQTQSRSKVNERGVNKNINIFIIHFLHTPQNSLLARDESRPKKKTERGSASKRGQRKMICSITRADTMPQEEDDRLLPLLLPKTPEVTVVDS